MTEARFLQIHTLTSYTASLLNRDDVGMAKRLPFGGAVRTRISSQCLKRHWRTAVDDWSLTELGTNAVRSRQVFSRRIAPSLRDRGHDPVAIVSVLNTLKARVLGESDKAAMKKRDEDDNHGTRDPFSTLETSQVIVLGEPEITFICENADALLRDPEFAAAKDTKARERVIEARLKSQKANLDAFTAAMGLDGALFGRMVTSDILARGDAAVHVAHAFTVHAQEAEPDYFSAVDDLSAERGELGSGHINTTELTSGLFYGYVVVDVGQLVENLSQDRALAARVVEHLVHLIATVSPGAKLGSTAPYSYADLVLIEAGGRQPRSLANAFLKPVPLRGDLPGAARGALAAHLVSFDAMYGKAEERQVALMTPDNPLPADRAAGLDSLAAWAAAQVTAGTQQ